MDIVQPESISLVQPVCDGLVPDLLVFPFPNQAVL